MTDIEQVKSDAQRVELAASSGLKEDRPLDVVTADVQTRIRRKVWRASALCVPTAVMDIYDDNSLTSVCFLLFAFYTYSHISTGAILEMQRPPASWTTYVSVTTTGYGRSRPSTSVTSCSNGRSSFGKSYRHTSTLQLCAFCESRKGSGHSRLTRQ